MFTAEIPRIQVFVYYLNSRINLNTVNKCDGGHIMWKQYEIKQKKKALDLRLSTFNTFFLFLDFLQFWLFLPHFGFWLLFLKCLWLPLWTLNKKRAWLLTWAVTYLSICTSRTCTLPLCVSFLFVDFPGGPVVKNLPANVGDHGFSPWSGKISHAAGQLSLCATRTEPTLWSLHGNCWAHVL